MRKHAWTCLAWGVGAVLLIQACGCNLMPSLPGKDDLGPPSPRPEKKGPNAQEKSPVSPGKNEYLAPPPTPLPELSANLSQKMSALEDDRKVLAARMQQMDIQLQEKDKAIILANHEIKEATIQVSQTREELKRWKEEMETLRGQLRNVEKENKGTLEAIIKTLEQFMEREKGNESTGPILPKQSPPIP
jgi:hypothetical protein